ncbi:hypothetical protein CNBC0320 [Cryptococcus deneoformans B-3501A]|uniref:Uncharacterized protein n=1 Tax=Cryptococcus deneoformans (strain JEC21 / ATCC MYA-565) TaxID=214684 RepID=Q5KJE1_CRYD1|nr:hypothetical protein CNC06860 [Cryptococcus neoformans var. neoformans JEC21]XP_776538.1 hypothetical protein CNBC0320 [Cryptococcus neoformans var. neoformans B-3501A]AAW42622.1 hypothetical protein CNC06860 [Cryptococcus neoformans var. neoformans JEC21]EAL21891.1 hypothetical protein CNBC0320 [Cryptococcus neoformans var. neoformans B-3501A]
MKRSPTRPPRLRITDGDDDEDGGLELEPEIDPLSALVLQSGGRVVGHPKDIDPSTLPSVKPHDSMSLVSRNLAPSENILFLTVSKPSVITLSNVMDKKGDKFHITPRREAVIIECPTGGKFVEEHRGKVVHKPEKPKSAELRCVGDEEMVYFQARGVSPLRVGWEKKSKDKSENGFIEAALKFAGQAPFELGYRHTSGGRTSRHVLKSVQEIGILHLSTEPGSHLYDFLSLADGIPRRMCPSLWSMRCLADRLRGPQSLSYRPAVQAFLLASR